MILIKNSNKEISFVYDGYCNKDNNYDNFTTSNNYDNEY